MVDLGSKGVLVYILILYLFLPYEVLAVDAGLQMFLYVSPSSLLAWYSGRIGIYTIFSFKSV